MIAPFEHPPRTTLSLLYNATSISAYRRESHEDLRTSFERFNVTDGAIQEACIGIETAAYEARAASADPDAQVADPSNPRRYREAQTLLQTATERFFELLAPELVWFLENYADLVRTGKAPSVPTPFSPSEWLSDNRLFLDLVYHILYAPGFATAACADSKVVAYLWGLDDGPHLVPALKFAEAIVAGTSQSAEGCSAHVRVICEHLNKEYVTRGWLVCW